ncbi:MAG: ROK family protein, partial [Deltaproteobacteria bacterium]|nr:ROK family protein [Deltaproteobacteria bacterium]
DRKAGAALPRLAGGRVDRITAKDVALACGQGDPLAARLVEEAGDALVAGAASLANAFNPARLILGGGVVEGLPDLVERVRRGLPERALATAAQAVEVCRAKLGGEAGVVGAAAFAFRALVPHQ